MSHTLLLVDQGSGQQREIVVEGGALTIGKSAENDLALDHSGISRRHCRIENHGNTLVVRDVGSRNGTYVDGRRIEANMPVPLGIGQVVQLGGYTLQLTGAIRNAERPPIQPGSVRHPHKEPQALPQPSITKKTTTGNSQRVTPLELKRQIHSMLLDRMDLKHTDLSERSSDELRMATEQVCSQIVQEIASRLPAWLTPAALIKEVVDEAIGLGPIEDLLADESVDEIMVVNWDKIYVERKGKLQMSNKRFMDNQQVIAIMRRILAPIGRRIDETSPMADGRLADGSRVNAIISPLALSGPTLTIRKFAKNPFGIDDLVDRFGSVSRHMAEFLELAVQRRANILISGGTGSGKTTLLNVTSNFIPNDERIVTAEDAAELQLQQDHVVRLESRPANLEGKNAIPIRDLVKNALRMRPDRIVVGECRGGEALDMLQAMNTGHDGSLTTLHANTPRDALSRLETLVLMAGMELPSRAIREQIASAIDFIVQVSRMLDGTRKVTHITAVTGIQSDVIVLQDIFVYEQEGFDENGMVIGRHKATGMVPDFVQDLRKRGIAVNLDMFKEEE